MKRYILILIVFIATFALGYATNAAQFGAVENMVKLGYTLTITYANNTVNVASTAANNQTSTTYHPTTVTTTQTYTTTITKTITLPNGETKVVTEVQTVTIPKSNSVNWRLLGLGAVALLLLILAAVKR